RTTKPGDRWKVRTAKRKSGHMEIHRIAAIRVSCDDKEIERDRCGSIHGAFGIAKSCSLLGFRRRSARALPPRSPKRPIHQEVENKGRRRFAFRRRLREGEHIS